MLNVLNYWTQPAVWQDGPSIGAGPAPVLNRAELQATSKAVKSYYDERQKGPVSEETRAEASQDLVALSKSSTLSSSEVAQVNAIRAKVVAAQPLTDADLKQLTAIVDKLASKLQAPPAPAAAPAAATPPFDDKASRKFFADATAAYKGGNYAGAEQLFRHSLATADPDKPEIQADIHYNLARSLQHQGRKDDAVREYNAYLHGKPGAKDADAVRAEIKKLGGEPSPQAPAGEEGAQRHYDTGETLFRGDLHGESTEAFRRAIAASPPDRRESVAMLHYNMGQSLTKLGNKEEAIQEYNSYLHASPNAKDADEVKAKIKALGGEVTTAPPAQQAAQYRYELGRTLYNGGRNAQAESEWRQALKECPAEAKDVQANLHWNIGKALENQGKKDEALKEYQAALQAMPKGGPADDARKRIKELGGTE